MLLCYIDRYQHRPDSLNNMCLAEFAANYVTSYQSNDDNNDVLPQSDSDTSSVTITLTNGFGKMHKRKREAVIRFRDDVSIILFTNESKYSVTS